MRAWHWALLRRAHVHMDPRCVKVCPLCSCLLPSLMHLLKHIRDVHAHRPGFCITCCLSGCRKQFKKFEVYRNHVYDFHTESESILQSAMPPTLEDENQEECMNHETDPFCDPVTNSSKECLKKKAAATWILKIQEIYKLPQSTMEQILKDVTGFFQNILIDLQIT